MLREGMRVAVVPPLLKGDRWHTVGSVSADGGPGQMVALSGVRDIAAADELVGKTLLADVADLPEGYALHDADALLGREVVDERYGALGTIDEILVGVANDVWVIQGPYGEVLVPVVDEVVSPPDGEGPIRVSVPAGTIDDGEA